MSGMVTAVSSNGEYSFTKPNRDSITLLAGLGVEGDVHAGVTVKHRSRMAQDPTQPNLRQVHLIHEELFAEVDTAGFRVAPGELGENITTSGIDLLGLPVGTVLHIGDDAVVEVTGLRNPCRQIDAFQDGLLKQVVGRDDAGNIVRKAGIMSVVKEGGVVRPGDLIKVELPDEPHRPLDRVSTSPSVASGSPAPERPRLRGPACYTKAVTERSADVVRPGMLSRSVDSRRYRGLVRPDKTVRWAEDELEKIERMRGRPADAWPTATALPESLDHLAELLTELGWDDLASLARREELSVYQELDAGRPGVFSGKIAHVLAALRGNLVDVERYEEALDVVDEQLRLSGRGGSARVPAGEAQNWRTVLLARLGRHDEALESAAAAVDAIRGRHERHGDASVDVELSHALAVYADRLDVVGRVAEAAEVTIEVAAYWREQSDSTVKFLATVDRLSERLVRSGRSEEAGVYVTEAMRKVRRRKSHHESAGTWHRFGVRLLSLDLPKDALAAAEKAVKLYRDLAQWTQEGHRRMEAADDWDDDHRYAEWYLLERRREEEESSRANVRRAEQNLRDGLLTLSACLRRLGRVDEATAADAEAAALSPRTARPSGQVPPEQAPDE